MSARAPSVLLLHGQPGTAADWCGVVPRLEGRAEVIAIDRPGWNGVDGPADLHANSLAALAALDGRRVDRAVVVGHSLGAAIAAWLAALFPERVRALVLVAPAANVASLYPVDYWLARPGAGELVSLALVRGLGLGLSIAPVRHWLADRGGLDAAYLADARRVLLRRAAWRAYATEQRALIRDLPALEDQLAAIRAPTTVLAGGRDRIVPARAYQALAAQIPGARLAVDPRAGHMLPQRRPELVADAILAALADLGSDRVTDGRAGGA